MFVEALASAADASNPLITVVTEANKFDSEEERTSTDDRLTSRNDSNPNLVTKYPASTRPFFATKDVHENSEEAFFANVLYTPGRAFLGKGKGQSFGPCVLRKQSPVIGPPQSPALEVKRAVCRIWETRKAVPFSNSAAGAIGTNPTTLWSLYDCGNRTCSRHSCRKKPRYTRGRKPLNFDCEKKVSVS